MKFKYQKYVGEIVAMNEDGDSSRKIARYLIKTYSLNDGVESLARNIRRYLKAIGSNSQTGSKQKESWDEKENNALFITNTDKPVKTKAQAIKISGVDMAVWEVERWVWNSWGMTNAEGNSYTNYQVKLWFVKRKKKISQYYDELADYIKKSTKPTKFSEAKGTINVAGVWAICDTHLGLNNEGNGVDELCRRFNLIADVMNIAQRTSNHLFIAGDLLESGAGTYMHATQVFEAIPELTGASGVRAFWVIFEKHLLSRLTVPITSISIVAGNHDRTAKDSKNASPFGSMAEIFYYFLKDNVPGVEINYNYEVVTKTIDGICYILTHGENAAAKNLAMMVHDYGNIKADYHVLITAHYHSRKSKHAMVKKSIVYETKITVTEENLRFRQIQLPPLCRANTYAKKLGKSSGCGFAHIERSQISMNINHHDYAVD